VVENQTGNLTPGPSFGHNLCFRCPNEQCEPILDIYVPRAFQWYKKHHNPLSFDPCNRSLKFWESIETPSPKVGVALGVWEFTPSNSLTLLTLPGVCDVTPRLHALAPGFLLPWLPSFLLAHNLVTFFALVASPKLGLRQLSYDKKKKH